MGIIPPQVAVPAIQGAQTLAQRLAALEADAALAAAGIIDASAVALGAGAVAGAGIIYALPNEWFLTHNLINQNTEDDAIALAQKQVATTLATKGIGISHSAASSISPKVTSSPSTPPIAAGNPAITVPAVAKNQVATPPQPLHAQPNPFYYPSSATINLPARRLSPSAPQIATPTPTPTPIQQVHHGSGGRIYGQLLHSPKGDFYHMDYQFDVTQWNTDFTTGQTASAALFSEWVKGKSSPSILETGLIFVDIPNTSPAAGQPSSMTLPLFGTGISQLMNQYGSRGKPANQMPTHGLIPAGLLTAAIPLAIANPLNPIGGAGAAAQSSKVIQSLSKIKPANLLSKVPAQFEKIKAALLNSWVLEFLTFCMTMHNASMLSTNIVQSCAQVIDNTLAIFGLSDLIKDEHGNTIDVMGKLGINVQALIQYAIGKNTYAQIKEKWNLFSTVYTAGANVLNTVGTMQQATMQVIQVTGSYVGRIGNALKADGVVGDGFGWMDEAISARSARYDKLNQVLDETQQFSGDMAIVSGGVLSAKQAKDELKTQTDEFTKSLSKASDAITQKATVRDKESTPPTIEQGDERT